MARIVGANEEELIHEYDALHGAPTAIRAADVFEPATPIRIKERRSPNWTLAMAVVLVLILGYGVYRVVGAATSGRTVAARAAATSHHRPSGRSSAVPSASPTPLVPSNVVIHLTAIEDCWVEFTSQAGQFISQAYVVGGDSKTWTFQQAVNMQIGNPGGIVLTVNGRRVGSPGSAGQPVTLSLGPGRPVSG